MQVKVLSVTERNQLDTRGNVSQVLVIKYMVGSQGPFSLVTTAADVQSGAALTAMTNFAGTLGTLPIDAH